MTQQVQPAWNLPTEISKLLEHPRSDVSACRATSSIPIALEMELLNDKVLNTMFLLTDECAVAKRTWTLLVWMCGWLQLEALTNPAWERTHQATSYD